MEELLNRTYKTEHEKQYNILCVDDEQVNLRIFERAFKRYYGVYTASSGKDAIRVLQDNRIDLIMTDQRMPNMTGSELLLRIVPKYPNIVRMIMTGFSNDDSISEVEEKVGLDRFFVKPWNKDDLKEEFDRALSERFQKVRNEDESYESRDLDLVESTLSLVENENVELNSEINSLVEATKSKKRPEFVRGDANDLLSLKESLMPLKQEVGLYIDDALIVYDHRAVNKNGYWFGEQDDHLIVASFFTSATAIHALMLNTFIGVMLTEMLYKERHLKADKLIDRLSMRISSRFIGREELKNETVDIAVMSVNRKTEELTLACLNHDVYFYNDSPKLQIIKGHEKSLIPGGKVEVKSISMNANDFKEMYFIPKNIISETREEGTEELESLRHLLEEIHKYPMSMQRKFFDEYHYKSVIGLRL